MSTVSTTGSPSSGSPMYGDFSEPVELPELGEPDIGEPDDGEPVVDTMDIGG